jgi:hypothetical protein
MLLILHRNAERVLQDVAHGLDALHGNGDVLDALDLHGCTWRLDGHLIGTAYAAPNHGKIEEIDCGPDPAELESRLPSIVEYLSAAVACRSP